MNNDALNLDFVAYLRQLLAVGQDEIASIAVRFTPEDTNVRSNLVTLLKSAVANTDQYWYDYTILLSLAFKKFDFLCSYFVKKSSSVHQVLWHIIQSFIKHDKSASTEVGRNLK
jgi:hypothetical protein